MADFSGSLGSNLISLPETVQAIQHTSLDMVNAISS